MKILLIEPPFQRLKKIHEVFFPLGLGYLASNLSKHGFDVKIYNAEIPQEPLETEAQAGIKYETRLEQHIHYREALADNNHIVWRNIQEIIEQHQPSLVGISVRSAKYPSALKTANIIKTVDPNCRIIFGGPHPTISPLETIANDSVDYILKGESEASLVELCRALDLNGPLDEVPGLIAKKNGKIQRTSDPSRLIPDLDSLPFPGRELVLDPHLYSPYSMGAMVTGRGCPFSCGFCSAHCLWGRKVRYRSVENVIQEIKEVSEKYNPGHLTFWDDSFTVNRDRVITLCRSLVKHHLGLRWTCTTRPDLLDEELLENMKEAGCTRIDLGIETGSEKMLKLINKGINLNQAEKAVRMVKKHKIHAGAFFMTGFPEETLDDIHQTMAFMKTLKASRYVLSIFTPYPGTALYEKTKSLGLIPDQMTWENFDHQSPDNHFSKYIDKQQFNRIVPEMAAWIDRHHNRIIRGWIDHAVVNSRYYFRHPGRLLKKLREMLH